MLRTTLRLIQMGIIQNIPAVLETMELQLTKEKMTRRLQPVEISKVIHVVVNWLPKKSTPFDGPSTLSSSVFFASWLVSQLVLIF